MKPLLQKAPRAQSLWSHPDFRLVMPARAVSFLGDAITLIVLALKIAETDQPLRITVVYAAFALPLFALAPWAGRIVDEYDSRLVLVLAGSLQVVGSLGLVLAPTFGAIVGAVLVLQIGQSVTQPAWSALVPRIVGDDLVGKAMGLQQSLTAAAGLAGAAVGGALYAALGYRDAILCDTVTFALLVVVGGLVRTRRGRRYDAGLPPGATEATQDDLITTSGWTYCRTDALLRLLLPSLWLLVIAAEGVNVVDVFLIRQDLNASATLYGIAGAAFMLGSIIGPMLAGRVTSDRSRIALAAGSACGVGGVMVAVGLSPSVWIVIVLLMVAGLAMGAFNTWISAVMLTRPPEGIRGRVMATMNGTLRGFTVLALVLGGMLGQALGARTTFVICGVLMAAVSVLVARSRRALAVQTSGVAELSERG